MKKLLLSLSAIALLTVFTISCGDDDEKDSNPLIGTWAFSKDVYSGCDDEDDNSSNLFTCTASDCYTITFKSGGIVESTETVDSKIETSTGKYSISGSNVILTEGILSVTLAYKITGSTLTLDYGTDEFDGCKNVETYTKK